MACVQPHRRRRLCEGQHPAQSQCAPRLFVVVECDARALPPVCAGDVWFGLSPATGRDPTPPQVVRESATGSVTRDTKRTRLKLLVRHRCVFVFASIFLTAVVPVLSMCRCRPHLLPRPVADPVCPDFVAVAIVNMRLHCCRCRPCLLMPKCP